MAEVWDDLQCGGLMLLRDTEGFTYGHDAVLLAGFARVKPGERLLDLGCGTGILALLIHAKTGAQAVAVDIDAHCCALAQRSVLRNDLAGAIAVHEADLRALPALADGTRLDLCGFDCAVCNPPYYAGGTESPDPSRRRSTHETDCTLSDVAAAARRMLKNGGRFFVCYPAAQLSRLCAALERETLAPKRLCFVRAQAGKPPYLVLVEAKKGGKSGLSYEPDTILAEG